MSGSLFLILLIPILRWTFVVMMEKTTAAGSERIVANQISYSLSSECILRLVGVVARACQLSANARTTAHQSRLLHAHSLCHKCWYIWIRSASLQLFISLARGFTCWRRASTLPACVHGTMDALIYFLVTDIIFSFGCRIVKVYAISVAELGIYGPIIFWIYLIIYRPFTHEINGGASKKKNIYSAIATTTTTTKLVNIWHGRPIIWLSCRQPPMKSARSSHSRYRKMIWLIFVFRCRLIGNCDCRLLSIARPRKAEIMEYCAWIEQTPGAPQCHCRLLLDRCRVCAWLPASGCLCASCDRARYKHSKEKVFSDSQVSVLLMHHDQQRVSEQSKRNKNHTAQQLGQTPAA